MQLGSWALGRTVCCRYPDADVLVLDELEETDWEPGHRSGRREQVIQVLVGLLVAYSQRGGSTNDGDDRIFVNHCHWERGAPEEAGWRS